MGMKKINTLITDKYNNFLTKKDEPILVELKESEVEKTPNSYCKEGKNITHLNLSGNKIHSLHFLIENADLFTDLEYLNLSNNQIRHLIYYPDKEVRGTEINFLGNLKKLEVLDLSGNQIRDISPVSMLPDSLKTLDLADNCFIRDYDVLNTITQKEKFQKLILTHNEKLNLPNKNLSNITFLEKLEAKGIWTNYSETDGKEKRISYEIKDYDLSSNTIQNISLLNKVFSNYNENFATLNLSTNQISDIKPLKDILKKLTELKIEKNPFIDDEDFKKQDIKINENENHLQAIKAFFSDDEEGKFLPAKIMLLGNHAVGKSSFLEVYLGKKKDNNGTETDEYVAKWDGSTHGLKIIEHEDSIYFDFGGQDYYHGINQLFF